MSSSPPPGSERRTHYPIDREHPIGGEMSDIIRGIVTRARLTWLLNRYSRVPVLALFSFVNGCISIGLMSLLAVITNSPFVFPSLGPTAFLFFFAPTAPSASPRNALFGHAIGLACGYASLWVVGLQYAPSAMTEGVNLPRVLAAALSVACTGALMILLRVGHPPAGATTLIVSLGILRTPEQMIVLMVAVVLLTIQAFVINRLAGIPYPLWSAPRPAKVAEGSRKG